MFSVIGTTPMHRIGALQPRDGQHRADHRGAAGHVVLHLVHVLGRLDRDAAGVERDALADEAERRRRPARLAGSCRSTSRRGGSWLPRATPSSMPHVQRRDARLVEHVDRRARPPAPAPAPRSAKTRGVRRLPGSFASVRAMFDALAHRHAARHVRGTGRRRRRPTRSSTDASQATSGDALERRALEVGEGDALGQHLRPLAPSGSTPGPVHHDRQARRAALPGRQAGGGRDAAQPIVGAGPRAVRRRPAAPGASSTAAARRASDRPRRACRGTRAARGPRPTSPPVARVEAGLVGEVVVLEDREDQQVGVERRRSRAG